MKIRRSTAAEKRRDDTPAITATLRAFIARNADKIADFNTEPDGIFIYLKPGWSDDAGAHTIRGDNSTDAIKRFRDRVKPEKAPQ